MKSNNETKFTAEQLIELEKMRIQMEIRKNKLEMQERKNKNELVTQELENKMKLKCAKINWNFKCARTKMICNYNWKLLKENVSLNFIKTSGTSKCSGIS